MPASPAPGWSCLWLLVSTLGDNNDLGLRAIIPAEMVLIVSVAAAAAGLAKARLGIVVVAIALVGLALSLPDTATMIHDNVAGRQRPGGAEFAQSPDLWAAVRRYAPPAARVANNPLFVKDVTPWPVNISWALLANRSSCFAGLDLALAFAPLPPERREAINAQFVRVFAGEGTTDDVHDHGDAIWLRRCGGSADRPGLGPRSVRRKSRLSSGGNARGPLADLREAMNIMFPLRHATVRGRAI